MHKKQKQKIILNPALKKQTYTVANLLKIHFWGILTDMDNAIFLKNSLVNNENQDCQEIHNSALTQTQWLNAKLL